MKVKKYLTAGEFANFVGQMRNAEFDNGGAYEPEVGLLAFRLCLVRFYTDLELPEDFGLAYGIINELRLDTKILDFVNGTEQYGDLVEAIWRARDYKCDSQIGIHLLYKTITDSIKSIPWGKLDEKLGELLTDDKIKQFSEIIKDVV